MCPAWGVFEEMPGVSRQTQHRHTRGAHAAGANRAWRHSRWIHERQLPPWWSQGPFVTNNERSALCHGRVCRDSAMRVKCSREACDRAARPLDRFSKLNCSTAIGVSLLSRRMNGTEKISSRAFMRDMPLSVVSALWLRNNQALKSGQSRGGAISRTIA